MQPSIAECLGLRVAERVRSDPEHGEPVEVFDLFCGCGGFSSGASAAGFEIAFACDCCERAVEAFCKNHPAAYCVQQTLPVSSIPFPVDGRPFHVHGSPPCQHLSSMRTTGRTASDKKHAQSLVNWFLDTALASGASSWSMEQVASRDVLCLLERYRAAHQGRVAYAVVDFSLLGVPQTRKRVIAGSPRVVAALQRRCSAALTRAVRDVIQPRGANTQNTLCWSFKRLVPQQARQLSLRQSAGDGRRKYTYVKIKGRNLRPVSKPTYTVCTTCDSIRWATWRGTWLEQEKLSVAELAALQTFPADYWLPVQTHHATTLIGNAVPPLVAQHLMECARLEHSRRCGG
jgi:DNA (cytosine-5)-methyltransferase 1